ncbi:Hexaprenyldihydroxybenzoate methyltransferase, mitochondrial [Coemansia sp. S16]|nr:Hexaprenyldihydroxybenzoate methyltransferase, mitochondrial [Coemansia sp. S16]
MYEVYLQRSPVSSTYLAENVYHLYMHTLLSLLIGVGGFEIDHEGRTGVVLWVQKPFTSVEIARHDMNNLKFMVNASEVNKFIKDSALWWDTTGPFKYLHTMNRTRTQFIRSHLADLSRLPAGTQGRSWISGRRLVDVGCGGGLASESLARLGMRVLGVDAAKENVEMARIHAQRDPALKDLEYVQSTAEQLMEKEAFDVVVSLEVIEHVADPMAFVKSLVDLAKPGASIFISTMSRTPIAAFVDVLVPEYLLNVVPRGTHDYKKFIKPTELSQMLRAVGAETLDTKGLILDPISNQCHLVDRDYGLLRNIGVQANYIMAARKYSK